MRWFFLHLHSAEVSEAAPSSSALDAEVVEHCGYICDPVTELSSEYLRERLRCADDTLRQPVFVTTAPKVYVTSPT